MDNLEHDDFLKGTINQVYALQEIKKFLRNPSLNNEQRLKHIQQVLTKIEIQDNRSLAERVREYVDQIVKGEFYSREVAYYFGLKDKKSYDNIHAILKRLESEGLILHDEKRAGKWRKLNNVLEEVDWKDADSTPLPVNWPFDINSFYRTFPKTIAVIAGTPGSGKTAFFQDFIKRNQKEWGKRIRYFCSDMGKEEAHDRFSLHEDTSLDDWTFSFYERGSDFADCIFPSDINIFDFMEVHGDDFVNVGKWLKEIWHKLDTGIALVGLQKMWGAPLGRGGIGTLEKARLYLTIEFDKENQCGVMKVEKCKSKIKGTNYWGFINEFKLYDGWKFNPGMWHPEYNVKSFPTGALPRN